MIQCLHCTRYINAKDSTFQTENPTRRMIRHVQKYHKDVRKRKLEATDNHFVPRPPINHGFNATTVTALPVETNIHPLEGSEFEPIVNHQTDLGDAFDETFAMQLIDNLLDVDNCVVGASPGGESANVVSASRIGKPTNTSRDTPSPGKSLDMPGTPIFQSNNDGNEDQSSKEHNDFCSEEDALFYNDSSCKETMKASLIRDEEHRKAVEYVNQFTTLDLNPNKDSIDNWDEDDIMPTTFDIGDQREYSFHDFDFFDFRTDADKVMYRSTVERISQVQIFFWQKYCHKHKFPLEDFGGWLGLVGRSNNRDREDPNVLADPDEAKVMFKLFHLLMNMSDSQKEELIDYQRNLFHLLGLDKQQHNSKTRFPTNLNESKEAITKGANSILKNFPSQRVFEIGDHACVDLKETVLLHAGHGADLNFGIDGRTGKKNSEGLNGTQAMTDLIEDVRSAMKDAKVEEEVIVRTSIGYLLFWSDAFLRCFIKQKENSVWILTVTICPPEHMKSSGLYTHVLAMGKSGQDHTPVVEYYMRKVKELMVGFDCYFGSTNKIERVSLAMITWNADRPENQSLTHTMKEGHYGKVTGWAAKVSEDKLPACIKCYKALIKGMINEEDNISHTPPTCNNCCNWSFTKNPKTVVDGIEKELQANDHKTKDFPVDYPLTADSEEVQSESWGSAIEPQPEGRDSGLEMLKPKKLDTQWMLQAVRSGYYGVRFGKWSRPKALEFMRTCNINTSTADKVIDKALRDKILGDTNASAVEPNFWKEVDCFSTFKFPNLPLHGLGHGMIPDVMLIVHLIFSKYGKRTKFYEYANSVIEDIASFRLDYCKAKALPKAAWVGEHSMAFMRLMSYLYGQFLMNNELGDSEEARITVSYIKCMLNSFQALISIFMTKKEVPTGTIDNHIKLFMSSTHYLHKKHGNLDKKKNDQNGPGKKKRGKSRTKTFISLQTQETLQAMLREFEMNDEGDKKTLQKRLTSIVIKVIVQKLIDLGTPEEECEKMLKDDLLKMVCGYVLPELDNANVDNNTNDEQNEPKVEKMCWNAGNWVSFMANISEQIKYLGSLSLIW